MPRLCLITISLSNAFEQFVPGVDLCGESGCWCGFNLERGAECVTPCRDGVGNRIFGLGGLQRARNLSHSPTSTGIGWSPKKD